jgi:hypothetical protein
LMTVRMSTFVKPNGEVEIVESVFKVICGNKFVDNWRGGKNGNYYCYVDANTGRITRVIGGSDEKLNFHDVQIHPDTGKNIIGFEIPKWQEVIELARDAALKFMPIRCLGWDIAVTNNGVFLLEGNAWWEHSQNKIREFKKIKELIDDAQKVAA